MQPSEDTLRERERCEGIVMGWLEREFTTNNPTPGLRSLLVRIINEIRHPQPSSQSPQNNDSRD